MICLHYKVTKIYMCFLIQFKKELSQRNVVTEKNNLIILVTTIALRLALPLSVPAALLGTHLTMHDFGVPDCGVAVIRLSDWWVPLALGLLLPLSVPAALLGTHLTMHDFGVPDCGVAVIRMSDWWVLLALGLLLPLSVPAAL